MTPTRLHRLAAALLAFFAVAHTAGKLDPSSKGLAVDLVVVAMRNARFPVMGSQRTLWDFYFGFGILVTVLLALAAWVSLELAHLAERLPGTAIRLGLAHTICLAFVSAICFVFFFAAPTITSVLACLASGIATAQLVARVNAAKGPSNAS